MIIEKGLNSHLLEKNEGEDVIEVILPTLNEQFTIGDVLKRTWQYADQITVIDGYSTDKTVAVAKEHGARVVYQNGFGKGDALREALNHCEGEVIVLMDADGSMIPDEIPQFVKEIRSGADIAKGSRFIEGGKTEDMSWLRKMGNKFFVLLVNLITRSNFTDLCYGYVAFRRDAVKKLSSLLEADGFDIETELLIKAKKLGLKIVEVPSFELKRPYGQSKLRTFRDGLKIFATIFRSGLSKSKERGG